jgi:hypothetical protein
MRVVWGGCFCGPSLDTSDPDERISIDLGRCSQEKQEEVQILLPAPHIKEMTTELGRSVDFGFSPIQSNLTSRGKHQEIAGADEGLQRGNISA